MPATGEQAGVWGNTVNGDFGFFDTGIDGNLSISLSANAYTLVTQNGVASEGRNKVITWAGAVTAAATVNIQPNTAKKLYFMINQTTGSFPLMFQQGTGAIVTLQPGYAMPIYCNGAGATASVNPVLANPQFNNVLCQNLTVSGTLTVSTPVTFSQPVTFSAAVTMASATVTSLTINPGGGTQATYDMYYRSSTGALARLPIGGIGQALVATSTGPGWATTAGLALGAAVGGAQAYAIFFYGPSGNNLSQDTRFNINSGVGLGIGLVPNHSLHIGMNLTPEVWLDTANSTVQTRQLVWASNGVARWLFYSPTSEAETGGNTGSNLGLLACNDSGSGIVWGWSITRATGNMAVGTYPGDQGSKFFVVGSNAGQPVLSVRGAASQSAPLQTWQNSAGTVVASIDASGNITSASSGSFVAYSASGRVDLHGTISGHPLGALHIGPEPGTGLGTGLRAAIAFELAPGTNDNPPSNVFRMYFRGRAMVIQYANSSGFILYMFANLPETSGATVTWTTSSTPV